jgi:NAD(P)H dehydrogenase (quinone)
MSSNILIIVANPKKESLSFAIVEKYRELASQEGHRLEVLDLYRDENQQPFFTYDKSAYKRDATKEMEYYQAKITWANKIVFVFPYWWGSMPAILKNFFDWNFSMGFAAVYVNGRPKGLLTDKSVKVFTTTGAPYLYYMFTGAHRRLRNMFKEQIFNFCGMKIEEFKIFGGADTASKNIDKIMASIKV